MNAEPWESVHICQPPYRALDGLRALYNLLRVCPTSTAADTVAIRSHIAYWSGSQRAESVTIRPSRGHSYRVTEGRKGETVAIVRVQDPSDHRDGIIGWTNL